MSAPVREAAEELGVPLIRKLEPLTRIRQSGGKVVEAFALEQNIYSAAIVSNVFDLE